VPLAVTISAPSHARLGGLLVYSIAYANRGTNTIAGARIIETVPELARFDADASTPGWSCAPGSGAGTRCVFELPPLAPGAAGEVRFAGLVIAAGRTVRDQVMIEIPGAATQVMYAEIPFAVGAPAAGAPACAIAVLLMVLIARRRFPRPMPPRD
jgi:hypothetical protein